MPTDAEVTASERESLTSTIRALDAELARQKALNWRMLEKRARDVARIGRLRSRLARVLRVEAGEMARLWEAGAVWSHGEWMTHRGGVWSRRALPTPTPDKARE